MRHSLTLLFFTSSLAFANPSPIPANPVQQLKPELAQVIAADAQLEILAEGFRWAEGPVAEPKTGDILFSDVPENKVWRWNKKDGLTLYLSPSGHTAYIDEPSIKEGSNGLIFNQNNQLVLAQHGDRRLAVLTSIDAKGPVYQSLTTSYQGKLFNSPNDLVQHSNGSYLFTDPPYGLKDADNSKQKQQTFNGVYWLKGSDVTVVTEKLTRPNGLALSPDEQWLYVANSDPQAAQWWKYPLTADGTAGEGQLFFDATAWVNSKPGLPDGLKVLPSGHLLATGPGGVLVFNAKGEHLGTIQTGVAAANVALSLDKQYLYITASSYLLRIKLKTAA
ncbi:SMP-30/gluconolactonase/LRE family protein [Rheinheimera sp. 1928-s]|uniref:SMP-30/gluconolactonase/LRE family protein n=1 Tax=Rheinheimera sp. 1928-s TaxID=3033803 RepID=UPI0026178235|nr:SMP-30/gluconolactonase/LRE family protein [Rheinheimera sp. 1928-s]MDF3125353.1 SMP-30/gluconolactonase/LRE family protein [Rheinheimera sp. 1928-s]